MLLLQRLWRRHWKKPLALHDYCLTALVVHIAAGTAVALRDEETCKTDPGKGPHSSTDAQVMFAGLCETLAAAVKGNLQLRERVGSELLPAAYTQLLLSQHVPEAALNCGLQLMQVECWRFADVGPL